MSIDSLQYTNALFYSIISIRKGKKDHEVEGFEDLPPCAPGHAFIIEFSHDLIRLGSPGVLDDDGKKPTYDDFVKALGRGNVIKNAISLMLPLMGMYILHTWLIENWLLVSANNPEPLFGYIAEWNDERIVPEKNSDAKEFEWGWVIQFVHMSRKLGESELHLIPPILSKEDFYKIKNDYSESMRNYPYRILLADNTKNTDSIQISIETEVREEPELISRVIDHMKRSEAALKIYLKCCSDMWTALRKGIISESDLTDQLYSMLLFQFQAWGDETYVKDIALATTAAKAAFMQDAPIQEKRSDPLRKKLDKAFNKEHHINRGTAPAEKEIDANTEELLIEIIEELKVIKTKLWPINAVEKSGLADQLASLDLKNLNRNHTPAGRFEHIRIDEPTEFLAKIAQRFLFEKTGKQFHLGILKPFISSRMKY